MGHDGLAPLTAQIRQWVLSFPYRVRYLLAYDAKLCSAVRRIFVRTLLGWLKERAESAGLRACRSGAVVVAQRFGSALNLNLLGPGPWATLLLPWLLLPAWRRDRRIRPELAAALLSSAVALVYAFLTYHADGVEMHRHMLLCIALQRAAFWIGAGVLVSTLCALLRARTALAPRSGDSR